MDMKYPDPSWASVYAWAEARIADLRKRNDDPNLDERETARLRGEIQGMKRLQDLPREVALRAQSHGPVPGTVIFTPRSDE